MATNSNMTAQSLAIPSSVAGYIRSLFGSSGNVWPDAGGDTSANNAVTVIYTFEDVSWGNYYGYPDEQAFSSTQRSLAREGMEAWANVANITFTQGSASTADMAFREYTLEDDTAGVTLTSSIGDSLVEAEVIISSTQDELTIGGYGYMVMMHEIGHGLGLKHPGNYDAGEESPDGPFLEDFGYTDSHDTSILSYNEGQYTRFGDYPVSPMIYDIAAIQYLYGANTDYNSGNTTYTLRSTDNPVTRWDGGGKDTLDASAFASAARLDLREGESYYSKLGNAYSWNAFGANIEHARGGSTGDVITGNSLNNVLIGNGGHDSMLGGQGTDTLTGGTGNDAMNGGIGIDSLNGGDGNDRLKGNDQNDIVNSGAGNDEVNGGANNDTLDGGAGVDTLRGGIGSDTITGGTGADIFLFVLNGGLDTITDFEVGTDHLRYSESTVSEATALANATQDGADVEIVLFGSTLILQGIDLDDLNGADFMG